MNASVEIETITPVMAATMLENRFEGQRAVRTGQVQRLASAIRSGNWKVTGDAITLIKGKLGNGQHRCEAIVLAGVPCKALILRTTEESLFDVMDSGISRTVADALNHYEIKNAVSISAAARLALSYDRGMITKNKIASPKDRKQGGVWNSITRQDVIDYSVHNRETLSKFCAITQKLYSGTAILSPSMAAAFLQIASLRNEKMAIEFITTIYTGDKDNAARDLRDRLLKNKLANSKMTAAYIFGLLIKGFKAYLSGTRPAYYKIGETEEFPSL